MALFCKASRDCGCTLWNYGEVCKECVDIDCLDIIETYDFRKCDCGSENTPQLYGEGIGRRYINYKNEFEPICWHELDGYVVECEDCGAITIHFNTPQKAFTAWNKHQLYFNGTKK